ncbi:ABC transporter substrate-binding protein [Variovorax sp. J22G21]|uniref:ABC transporter substrate-binding protein n=1 Tax=Variovorax fucosicus TaxID=3053517 RepID=UPI0025765329|nr:MULTISPECIES: ABC transporter substrate-binding protein [unclassified Variovorax]MDM0042502.1 ABC transporter substrate-binding protein [Variovorax sp. J22R193]MDM0054420.1 ABC transporter substrate-binding protein [Variovorax sp. J22G47]MDM0061107.1 ABC transporter substrate-binding protein [Variovorax sp. J22G21]
MKKMRVLCAAGLLGLGAVSAAAQILIGQTAAITGAVAANMQETITGAQLAIDHANAQGGIHGEQIEIVRLDDGFDVKRAGENARVLIEEKKVVALFLSRGTPHTQAIIPWLDKYGVALIGPSTGAMVLHKPVQKHVFNVRSTYQREAEKAVTHLHTVGIERIAVVHASDSFGKDGLDGATTGFTKAKKEPVVVVPADRDKPDYAAIVGALTKANPQAVLWIGSGSAVVDGIKALRAAGSAAQVVTLSNNASTGFIKQLGEASRGVIVTQVFPSERATAQPLVKEATVLAQAKGQTELSPATLEGFAAGKVLVEALRRAGPKPTRAKVLAALEGIRGFDLGGGMEISYSPQDHSGIDFADLAIISDGRFKR